MPTNAVSSIYDPFPQAYSSVQEEFTGMLSQMHGIRPESRRKMLYKETVSKTEGEETAPLSTAKRLLQGSKIITVRIPFVLAMPVVPQAAKV